MIGIDTTFLVDFENTGSLRHAAARAIYAREIVGPQQRIALTPPVVAEFLHAVTDARRFAVPLTMPHALERARHWWSAPETARIHSTDAALSPWLDWMREHRLGRKRVLDTQLAAALYTAGVRRLLTSNPDDFLIFGVFELLVP